MTDIFNLSPDEFRAQEEAERREAAEAREAKARAEREAAEREERKKEATWTNHVATWKWRLNNIGAKSGRPFEVLEPAADAYRSTFGNPCTLLIDGMRVPVSNGLGSSISLEIRMPWHTCRYDRFRGRSEPVETVRSRQKKDSSFNWVALGLAAARYADYERAYQHAEAAKAAAAGAVKELATELDYRRLAPSTDRDKPVQFTFSITADMTATEARAAVAALRRAGLLK